MSDLPLRFGLGMTLPRAAPPVLQPSFFDPSEMAAGMELDLAKLVATNTNAGYISGGVRTVMGINSGAYSSEFTVEVDGADWGVGFIDASADVTATVLGNTTTSVSVLNSGQVAIGNTFPTSVGALAAGAKIGFLIDEALRKFWITINGVAVTGDPAAKTGGYTIPVAITGKIHMVAFPQSADVSLSWAPEMETPVAGFLPWREAFMVGPEISVGPHTNYFGAEYTTYANAMGRFTSPAPAELPGPTGYGTDNYYSGFVIRAWHYPMRVLNYSHWNGPLQNSRGQFGVQSFDHTARANYDNGTNQPAIAPPVMVDNIESFTSVFVLRVDSYTGHHNALREYYLCSVAGDAYSKVIEIGTWPWLTGEPLAYFEETGADRFALGTFTNGGIAWEVRRHIGGGVAGDYVMAIPLDRQPRYYLELDDKAFLVWLKALGVIIGSLYINGDAGGIEHLDGDFAGEYGFMSTMVEGEGGGDEPVQLAVDGEFAENDAHISGIWFGGKTFDYDAHCVVFENVAAFDGVYQTGKSLIPGKFYEIEIVVTITAGSCVNVLYNGIVGSFGTVRTTSGTYTERVEALAGNDAWQLMSFDEAEGFSGTLQSFSIIGPYDTET